MTTRSALLPHKHLRFSDSLLALAGHLRQHLGDPRTVDELWAIVGRETSSWPGQVTFTKLTLALDVLYATRQIEPVADGRVRLVTQ